MTRWICFDIGETLVDESRVWRVWSDVLGVPPFTLAAALGAAIATGRDFTEGFSLVGAADWRLHREAAGERIGPLEAGDLYPDALSGLEQLGERGYRVAVAGNQPGRRTAELRKLGVPADPIVMSDELGAEKPSPAFFARVLDVLGSPDPGDVAYVGDRADNDVFPAAAAGLRPVWLRRGPWALLGPPPPVGTPALVVDSLTELADRADELWLSRGRPRRRGPSHPGPDPP